MPYIRKRVCTMLAAVIAYGLTSGALAELAVRDIYLSVLPSLAGIDALDEQGKVIASGSGFFVDSQGTFVTNYHVIEGSEPRKPLHFTG
jgi:S1-C subfamily serine protease